MDHLSLNWRKVLSGRIAIFTATARRKADVWVVDENTVKAYKLLEDHLLLRAGRLESSPDNVTLSAALATIISDLDTNAVTSQTHPLFDRTIEDITQNLRGIACRACIPQPACNYDAQIVARHGDCIRFFLECMQLAEEEAVAWYEKYLPGSLQTRPKIYLSTEYYNDDQPDSNRVAKYISGRTDFPDISENLSDIQLLLDVPKFDIKSYHATLYILFHEMICHAFQGLRTARANQERSTREIDAFSEGWMDWVTYLIFTEALQDGGWSDVNVADVVRDFSKDIRDITNQYRNERQDFLRREDPSSRTRAFFYIGEEVAQEYHRFLQSRSPSGEEADEIFYRISFDWNLDGGSQERQDFVTRVRQALKFKDGSISELETSLDRYLESGNIRDLIG